MSSIGIDSAVVSATMFLALKKVGVRQCEDSDSKRSVGVSTQTRLPAQFLGVGGGGVYLGACPGKFFLEKV